MRRCLTRRFLAITLLLARLALGDCVSLPAAQAADHGVAAPVATMMAGHPCTGMVTAAHGSCCRSGQCPCLHAPALMTSLQLPARSGVAYAGVETTGPPGLSAPPAVFFRPPIASTTDLS